MMIHGALQLLVFARIGNAIFIACTAGLAAEPFDITILMQFLHVPLDITRRQPEGLADILRFKTAYLMIINMHLQVF